MKIHLSSAAAGGCLSANYISQVSYWLGILGEGDQLTFFFFSDQFFKIFLKGVICRELLYCHWWSIPVLLGRNNPSLMWDCVMMEG